MKGRGLPCALLLILLCLAVGGEAARAKAKAGTRDFYALLGVDR